MERRVGRNSSGHHGHHRGPDHGHHSGNGQPLLGGRVSRGLSGRVHNGQAHSDKGSDTPRRPEQPSNMYPSTSRHKPPCHLLRLASAFYRRHEGSASAEAADQEAMLLFLEGLGLDSPSSLPESPVNGSLASSWILVKDEKRVALFG